MDIYNFFVFSLAIIDFDTPKIIKIPMDYIGDIDSVIIFCYNLWIVSLFSSTQKMVGKVFSFNLFLMYIRRLNFTNNGWRDEKNWTWSSSIKMLLLILESMWVFTLLPMTNPCRVYFPFYTLHIENQSKYYYWWYNYLYS